MDTSAPAHPNTIFLSSGGGATPLPEIGYWLRMLQCWEDGAIIQAHVIAPPDLFPEDPDRASEEIEGETLKERYLRRKEAERKEAERERFLNDPRNQTHMLELVRGVPLMIPFSKAQLIYLADHSNEMVSRCRIQFDLLD